MSIVQRAYDWVGGAFGFRNGAFVPIYGDDGSEGIRITEASSLRTIAVLRAVNLIAGTNAALPFDVYRKVGPGRRAAVEASQVELLLDSKPNDEMSSMDLRHFTWVSLLLWGNSYCRIVWRDKARTVPVALWPMMPDQMQVSRDAAGSLTYEYTVNGKKTTYDRRDVWHCRLTSMDGINGLSVINLARNGVMLNQLSERYLTNHLSGGNGQRIAVSYPGKLDDLVRKNLLDDWDKVYGGIANSKRPVMTGGGGTISTIGIPLRDLQFVEQMQFSDERIAMLFGIPPHMMGIVSKTTSWGTGIGEQKQGFLTFTLQPLLTFYEKSVERCLITEDREFCKHNTDAFLRSDIKARMEAHQLAIQSSIMSPNEARNYEDMEPYAGGDVYLTQSQNIPIQMAGKMTAPKPAPAPKEAA